MGSNGKRKSRGPSGQGKKGTNGKSGSIPPAAETSAPKDIAAEKKAEPAPKAEAKPTATPKAEIKQADVAPDEGAAPSAAREADDSDTDAPVPHPEPAGTGAAWAEPIVRFEKLWTRFESRLITYVLAAQILALVAWVLLKGLSQPVTAEDSSGRVFRAVVLCSLFGAVAWRASKQLAHDKRRLATMGGIVAGIAIGWELTGVGSGYFDNLKGWLQEGSLLTLMGGLRGVATRLTLWLALLGGSLATAAGKHIHIDVLYRFLPNRHRVRVAIVNYCAAALVCLAAVWGFFDHVATVDFGSKAEDSAGEKVSRSMHEIGLHFFLMRKQIGLDLRSLPHVLKGDRYDTWMTGTQWNEWVKDAGFEDRYKPDEIKNILVSEDTTTHSPLVLSPDGQTTRGILVDTLSLVFPFGLLAIGIRFLIRALLTLSGHLSADPDEMHKEELRSAGAKVEAEEGGA